MKKAKLAPNADITCEGFFVEPGDVFESEKTPAGSFVVVSEEGHTTCVLSAAEVAEQYHEVAPPKKRGRPAKKAPEIDPRQLSVEGHLAGTSAAEGDGNPGEIAQ